MNAGRNAENVAVEGAGDIEMAVVGRYRRVTDFAQHPDHFSPMFQRII